MICTMIIKAIRFRTRSSVNRLISHLRDGDDNDAVSYLAGTAADIDDMHRDASAKRSTYSIRHWIISPHEATTREQLGEVLSMLAGEFDFDPSRAVIVEHAKSRITADAYNVHWHILVGEVDPVTRKALRCSFDRIVHELIARWSEYKFGHRFIPGAHTKAVVAGLRKRGAIDVAESVEAQLGGVEPPSREAFTHAQHQARKRAGTDLPAIRKAVKQAIAEATTRAELQSALAASSLLVAAGDKRETWIVTDQHGEFIGSLARLSGAKKTEVDKIMKGADYGPANDKPDNRTNNSGRGAGHPQLVAATKRPANARPGHADPDTGENPGSPRKRTEPGRTIESEAELSDSVTFNPIGWFRSFDRYRDQLSLLLARANVSAMVPVERTAATLWELEERARADINRKIPAFEASEKTERLRAEIADVEKSVARKWDKLFDVQRRLGKVKRPRWWHYLIGIAFLFERQQRHWASYAQLASDEYENSKSELETVKSKLVRQELQDKERHASLVREIAKRQQVAGETLGLVAAANDIICQNPPLAFCGVDFILSRARDRIDEEKWKEAKMAKNLVNDGFGYKR